MIEGYFFGEMERKLTSSIERGRTPAEQFKWFLNICREGVDMNGTIVVFKDGEDHKLIRQSFVEIGEEYCEDTCVKAQAVKRASEAFLESYGIDDIEVLIGDRESAKTDTSEPVIYKEVAFRRIKENGRIKFA